jgi:replicative DNA helicase
MIYGDIEKAIISLVLTNADVQKEAMDILSHEFFAADQSKRIFSAMRDLKRQGIAIDIITVTGWFKKHDPEFNPATIIQYTQSVPASTRFKEYMLLLKQAHVSREIRKMCIDGITFIGQDEHYDGMKLYEQFSTRMKDMIQALWANDGVTDNLKLIEKGRERFYQRVFDAENGITPGITTGIHELNQAIGGWQNGHLNILGGRPGMGKSRMLLQMIRAAIAENQKPLFFTLEMTEADVHDLMCCGVSNPPLDPKAIMSGNVKLAEKHQKEAADELLRQKEYWLSSERELTQIRAISGRFVKDEGCKVIFVDFLQKIDPKLGRNASAEQRVSMIAVELKNMAKDLNVPVVSIVSLNRDLEKRGGSFQPQLSDIRDSGNIESEADLVLFVWRPKYYELKDEDGRPYDDEVFLLHGKGRFTTGNDIMLYHDAHMLNFYKSKQYQFIPIDLPKPTLTPSKSFYEADKDETF